MNMASGSVNIEVGPVGIDASHLPLPKEIWGICLRRSLPKVREPKNRNSAKVTLRVRGLCAILCNSERVLNVIHAVPGLPKSEFCAIAKNRP